MTDTPSSPSSERVAQLLAHRACHAAEHNPEQGRIHGYCRVCGIPWPCAYAGTPPSEIAPTRDAVLADCRAFLSTLSPRDWGAAGNLIARIDALKTNAAELPQAVKTSSIQNCPD